MFHHHHHFPRHHCPVWVEGRDGEVPQAAIAGGKGGVPMETFYVARCELSTGDIVPGKLVASKNCAYVGYMGAEHSGSSYAVLVDCGSCHYYWQPAFSGEVPPGAVEAGICKSSGDKLFIARGKIPSEPHAVHLGKLQANQRFAHILYNRKEYALKQYEVLCKRPKLDRK